MDRAEERKLLLWCTGVNAGERQCGKAPSLAGDAWEQLIDKAVCHNLAPLLHHALTRSGLDQNPAAPDILARLRRMRLLNGARNMCLLNALDRIAVRFKEEGISVILLKGALLSQTVYEDPALRPMCDLDLLAREADFPAIDGIMVQMGYAPRKDNPLWIKEKHRHLGYYNPQGDVSVEVHRNIVSPSQPFRVDSAELWRRARSEKKAGPNVLVLSAEDLILHLCVHSVYQHLFEFGLIALCDLARVLDYYRHEISWDRALRIADRWGARHCAYIALHLTRELLSADIPGEALDVFKPSVGGSEAALAWAKEKLFACGEPDPGVSDKFVQLFEKGSLSRKVVAACKSLFPQEEFLALTYDLPQNSRRIAFYRMIYPLELLVKYGRVSFGMLRGRQESWGAIETQRAFMSFRSWLEQYPSRKI